MHGLKGIAHANTHQTIKALEGLRAKSIVARKQNHPQTARFTAEYEALKAEVLPDLERVGYAEPSEDQLNLA